MPLVRPEPLAEFGAALLTAHGTPPPAAREVSVLLVRASLQGHDSHGVLRFGRYIDKIRQGTFDPRAEPAIARRDAGTATIDGRFGFGQLTARLGTKVALELARAQGTAAVSLTHCNHIGRLADYAEAIAGAGCVALIFSSGASRGGSVAPYGGRERVFGTNPIAWALPVPPGRGPLVADFSTSVVPEGKVALAKVTGDPLPPGVLLDVNGLPTTDPAAYYAGGALLAFGGHKGSSLALFVELVASLLGGSVPCSSSDYQVGNPTVLLAIAIERFRPLADYLRYTEELLQRVETSQAAHPGDHVRVPNDLELETAARRTSDGIPVSDALWSEFIALASAAGVALPSS